MTPLKRTTPYETYKTIYSDMGTVKKAAVIRKALRAVPGLKKVSVRCGKGTAGSWIDVSGSDEYGCFTDAEKEAIRALFPPGYAGGNGFGLGPDETEYWAERLATGNAGFQVNGFQSDYDQDWHGWAFTASRTTAYRIYQAGGVPELVMEAAKLGYTVRVGSIMVRWTDYSKGEVQRDESDVIDYTEITGDMPPYSEAVKVEEEEKPALIPPVKIEMKRAEGWTAQATLTGGDLWNLSDAILSAWSTTAPDSGGYDKCDFIVTYEDGETYHGRFDLKRKHGGVKGLLSSQIWHHVSFIIGQWCPPHMEQEQYQEYIKQDRAHMTEEEWAACNVWLATYELGEF
jgi:hypothetical protein